jgi:hypothetical protein
MLPLRFLMPIFMGLSRDAALAVRGAGPAAPDRSNRAAALAAVDTAATPWCMLSDGSLLHVVQGLPASFGCATAGEERCVQLSAAHLDQCVYVPARQDTGQYLNQLPEWRLGRVWLALGAKLGYKARRSGVATLVPSEMVAAAVADNYGYPDSHTKEWTTRCTQVDKLGRPDKQVGADIAAAVGNGLSAKSRAAAPVSRSDHTWPSSSA